MPAQNEDFKISYNPFFGPKLFRDKSEAVSFSTSILVIGFGGALFSHSFSKVLQMSECTAKIYLQAAMGVGLFQAISGFCIAILEWTVIQQKLNLNMKSLVKWIKLFTLIILLAAWIFIYDAISNEPSETKLLEFMRVMVICNCVLLCISCIVIPNHSMCFKSNEMEEDDNFA